MNPRGISTRKISEGMHNLACAHKINNFRHLDLSEDTTSLIIAKIGSIANGERVRSFNGNLSRLTAVKFCRPLDLCESDEVSIF